MASRSFKISASLIPSSINSRISAFSSFFICPPPSLGGVFLCRPALVEALHVRLAVLIMICKRSAPSLRLLFNQLHMRRRLSMGFHSINRRRSRLFIAMSHLQSEKHMLKRQFLLTSTPAARCQLRALRRAEISLELFALIGEK